MLACCVSSTGLVRLNAGDRSNIHDVAGISLYHGVKHSASHTHEADDVGLDRGNPLSSSPFVKLPTTANIVAGVIDENIDIPPVPGQAIK